MALHEYELESGKWRATGWIFGLMILVSRTPGSVFLAQFWAEDGKVWFAQAYNLAWWRPLLSTQDGYFQTFPRLCADLALSFPLVHAPLVMNLTALAVQAVPVPLLLSRRSEAWGTPFWRLVYAFVYLALPNCDEVTGTITNAQWILALSVFLLIAMRPPETGGAFACELILLFLCGATGPFCVFLVPVACVLAWLKGGRARWIRAGILGALFVLQISGLTLHGFGDRPHATLGAGVEPLVRLLAGHVFLPLFLGSNSFATDGGAVVVGLCWISFLFGMACVLVCFFRARLEIKLFLVLCAFLTASSLASPAVYPVGGLTVWAMLAKAGEIRYWFFPTLCVAWCLVWCVQNLKRGWRLLAASILLAVGSGIVQDWEHPKLNNTGYVEQVAVFERLPPGSTMTIRLNPAGWTMRLLRR